VSELAFLIGALVQQQVSQMDLLGDALCADGKLTAKLCELAQTIVLVLDNNAGIVSFNPYMTQLSGHRLDDVAGQDWFTTFLPERDRETHSSLFINAIADDPARSRVCPLITKQGRERLIEWYVSTVNDEQGDRVGFLALGNDVTESESLRAEISRQADLLEIVFDATPDPLALKDCDFVYQAVNPAFCEYVGKAKGHIIGKTDFDLFPRDKAQRHRRDDVRVMDAGVPQVHEEPGTGISVQGWLRVAKAPVRGKDGHVTGVLCSFREVSESKRTEEALGQHKEHLEQLVEKRTKELREQRSLLENILSTIPASVFWKDRDSVFLGCNEQFARDTGFVNARDIIGKTDYDLPWNKEEADFFRQCDRQVMDSGEPMRNIEEPQLKADGTQTVLLTNKVPLTDANGNVVGILGTYMDITERKRIEQEMRVKETAIESSSSVIAMSDLEGNLSYVNKAFRELWGYHDNAEILGRSAVEFWEDREQARNALLTLQVDGCWNGELRVKTKNGDVLDLEIAANTVLDPAGEPLCLMGFFVDVTQRKRAEEALKASEQRYRAIFDQAIDGIVLVDRDTGGFMEFNRCAYENLGYCQEEFAKLTVADIEAIESPEEIRTRMETITLNGKAVFETRHRAKDGGVREVLVSTKSVGIPGRQCYLAIYHDITERKLSEQVLREREARYRELVENMSDGVAVYETMGDGEDFIFKEYNGAAERIGGIPHDQVIGRPVREVFPGVEAMGLFEVFRRVWRTGEAERHPVSLYRDERLALWADNYVFKLPSGEIVAVYEDITERKQAEERLQLSASVFTQASEAIVITDTEGAIVETNDAFTRITGYSRGEAVGRNPRMLQSGRQGPEFYAAMWRNLTEKGHWSGELWNRRKSGEVYAAIVTISAIRDAENVTRHYVALGSDITAQKQHQSELEHIAHYDALTDLPNRVLLADRLQRAMNHARRRGQTLAVAYLDLDGFKTINDAHGHNIGDRFLMRLAARMKQGLREGDTIARLGGDEFALVLVDVADAKASKPVLARVLDSAADPVRVGDLVLQVSASLGLTFYPQREDVDADHLLRQADQAMYQAKLAGKKRWHVFDAEQDRSIRGMHESLERIDRALREREFVLHYQPKVNMRTGELVGAEALIRWQHPDRGLLLPADFLPVIEVHRLAVDVGEWVIDTALAQLEGWRSAGLNIPVSVNLGVRQLQQADFMDRLRELLARHPRIKPGDLELEVLETSALEDLSQASHLIRACRELGVQFALDDFGTGYSSLTYFRHLPADQVKIDQSFVREMLDTPDDLIILDGVLSMATAFGRQVIAEGVATVEHGRLLLQLGCDLAQGYGIARPMPAQELPTWAANWRPDPAWTDQPRIKRNNLPLLFACVEHRAWVRDVEDHLKSGHKGPPPPGHHQCRFGRWLANERHERGVLQPACRAVERLHRQVHGLAADLLELRDQGRDSEALRRLGELRDLRDNLLEQLKGMAHDDRAQE
jgi:diguanylate cyclase (GGDEF)-like protein/PAS domain S-box-containing protein